MTMHANDAVCPKMTAQIKDRLAALAAEENILILLAVESGSRAWGFHSTDSDYDVRFIYARPIPWHLGLTKKRDVVERPIDNELDLSGWDLGKALCLALQSNAVIAEWLQSPICYAAYPGAHDDLTTFTRNVLTRRPIMWHYLSMVRRQQERLVEADGSIRLKRFFYTLRPALALRWIRMNDAAMPPMDMASLLAGCDLKPADTQAILDLIEMKKQLMEKTQTGAVPTVLSDLVMDEVDTARIYLDGGARSKPDARNYQTAGALNLKYANQAGA
ncbi:nucleotidyltransferase domain-containing protein [Actibacterium sp. 188UL27-1]|uniref:nucleotidyltransferase domain-containing protein n=1 Tax=Actibacterium sp. 188UL27-1 TaxID=2786961 RepID=UPI001958478C|nr:nucleotidyltransferase domain-containing protein [Actibacterium sp. 188UL27-1]MBM7066462.1 nucleotidyltransferase domain-containing protein [Actibacterium sp. 188UL27-1]